MTKIKKTEIKAGDTAESIFEKFYDFFRTIPHEKLSIIPFGWFSMWLRHNDIDYAQLEKLTGKSVSKLRKEFDAFIDSKTNT